MEAVKKAEELQPDLVLLDLGLPKLNGMEVARRIRQLAPNSKILIVSQDSCVEVVLGAMRLGVRGHLCKSDVDELSIGVEAMVNGAQFVSSRLRHILPHRATRREQRRLFIEVPTTKSPLSEEPLVHW